MLEMTNDLNRPKTSFYLGQESGVWHLAPEANPAFRRVRKNKKVSGATWNSGFIRPREMFLKKRISTNRQPRMV